MLAGQAVGIAPVGAVGFVVGEGVPVSAVAYPPMVLPPGQDHGFGAPGGQMAVLPPGQDQRFGAQGGQMAYGTLVLH